MRQLARPGVVLGIVAVVLAGSTGAFAAAKITGAQIKDNTITGRDIKNRSIGTADLSRAAARALKGEPGPAGPPGPQGVPGPAGPAGPNVVSKLVPVGGTASLPAGELDIFTIDCPAGQSVVSGGFAAFGGEVWLSKTYDGRSWSVGIDATDFSIPTDGHQVWAHCAPTGSAVAGIAAKKRMTRRERSAAIRADIKAYRTAQARAR